MSKKDVGAVLRSDNSASFRVWAPFAKAVAVTGAFNDWSSTPLAAEHDGYWSVTIPKAQAGQEYKFIITTSDDRELRKNDPRSLQVTTTEDGNSVLVDTHLDWDDQDFTIPPPEKQIIYELHVGTFNRTDPASPGTFASVADKLDYLADLGITVVQLMPVAGMSKDRGWGYTPDFIYALESLYGSRHDFAKLVQAAHKRGMAVVLDVVYNHFGPDDNFDLWQFDGWSQDNLGGIYFYNDWRAHTPWGDRPDYGRPEVRQFITDNVRMWLQDMHIDGLRVDSTNYLRNTNGATNDPAHDIAEAWQLLQEITATAQNIKPAAITIAEDNGDNDYLTKKASDGGAGFTAQWHIGFPHVLRHVVNAVQDSDRHFDELSGALTLTYNRNAFERVVFSDSHDTASHSRLNEEIAPGDAANMFARKRELLAAAIVLSAPAIPMLFQGQEFMEDGNFNDWRALDWRKAEQYAGIRLAYQHLIALRKNHYNNTRGLVGQSCSVIHTDDANKVWAYHRWDKGGPDDDVVVVINASNAAQKDYRLPLPKDGAWQVRFNSDWQGYSQDFGNIATQAFMAKDGFGVIDIGAYSAVILSFAG